MTWQTKKLGEVCDLIKGKKPKIFVSKSNKPYLTAKVIRKTEKPKYSAENDSSSVWVKKENIVIIMDGSNSGEMFTGLEGALASTMGIVKYPEDLLDPKFLLHFLITHRENFTKSRTGAAIPHLNKEGFENLEIPLPSLQEQRRIVKIIEGVFDKTAKAKENTEKNLQNSKELFESYLQNIFSNLGRNSNLLALAISSTNLIVSKLYQKMRMAVAANTPVSGIRPKTSLKLKNNNATLITKKSIILSEDRHPHVFIF